MSSLEIESNNSASTANELTAGSALTGQISSNSDVDFYKLNVSGAGTAKFSITPSGLYPYTIDLYDTSGTLQRSYSTYDSGTYSIAAQSAGTVYAKISSYSNRDDYQITASCERRSKREPVSSCFRPCKTGPSALLIHRLLFSKQPWG